MDDTDTIKYVEEQLAQCRPLEPMIVVFSGRCIRSNKPSLSEERSLTDEEWLILPKEKSDCIEWLKSDYDEFLWLALDRGYYKIRIISNNKRCSFEYGRHDTSAWSIQNAMQPAVIFNLPNIKCGGVRHGIELHEFINDILGRPEVFQMNHLCYD